MKRKYTKAEIVREFKGAMATNLEILKGDPIAKRELWFAWTDMLCKEGYITEKQYNTWASPF